MYRAGSFDSAVAAYSTALGLDPAFLACYSNRAACHLAAGRYEASVRDCFHALSLLDGQEEGEQVRGSLLS